MNLHALFRAVIRRECERLVPGRDGFLGLKRLRGEVRHGGIGREGEVFGVQLASLFEQGNHLWHNEVAADEIMAGCMVGIGEQNGRKVAVVERLFRCQLGSLGKVPDGF